MVQRSGQQASALELGAASRSAFLDALDLRARRFAASRASVPVLYGATIVFGLACLAIGALFFGNDGVHQLFRDLGPASSYTSALMLCCAALGILVARRESRGGNWTDWNSFWFLAALGFLFLSVEAPLDVHGKLGLLIDEVLAGPPFINHWSDAVLGLYMAGGLAVMAFHWRELRRAPRPLALFFAGAGISAAMLAVDSGTAQAPWHQVAEESLELLAAATLLTAFLERFRYSVREHGTGPGAAH